jgi:hypothetical protein
VILDLKDMHNSSGLNTPNMDWRMFKEKRKEVVKEKSESRVAREVDAANILPDNSKRKVRFKI